jgi:hypothetical protein
MRVEYCISEITYNSNDCQFSVLIKYVITFLVKITFHAFTLMFLTFLQFTEFPLLFQHFNLYFETICIPYTLLSC